MVDSVAGGLCRVFAVLCIVLCVVVGGWKLYCAVRGAVVYYMVCSNWYYHAQLLTMVHFSLSVSLCPSVCLSRSLSQVATAYTRAHSLGTLSGN